MYIDFNSVKCKHCYKCVRNCEIKAINIRGGRAEIIEDHCVLCGKCLQVCPQEAKTLVSELGDVKAMIRRGERVAATVAPSYLGLLKFEKMGQVRSALMKLGFEDAFETSEGAAVVTNEYLRLIREGEMENIITTCCPAANELIELYHPSLVKYLAPVVSPMIASGEIIKKRMGQDVRVVFIGPCIAKRKEARDPRNSGIIDAVISFDDLRQWLEEESIEIGQCEDTPFAEDPMVNRIYPVTGGVLRSVRASLEKELPDRYRKFYVHGLKDCIDLCRDIENGGVRDCFIEINVCDGACIKGPTVRDTDVYKYKIKLDMQESVSPDPMAESEIAVLTEGLSFEKRFEDRSLKDEMPSEEEIRRILAKTGKFSPKDELNCGACGYPTCRDKAIAVFQNKAETEMCIPYLTAQAESMSNLIMEESPNAVILTSRDYDILDYSAAGERFFGVPRQRALKMKLPEIIDTKNCDEVFRTGKNIYGRTEYYEQYGITTLQNIVYIPRQNCILMTIIDTTEQTRREKQEYRDRIAYIDMAQDVIRDQMITAQKIAALLGETTAETKATLSKLVDSMNRESERRNTGPAAEKPDTKNRYGTTDTDLPVSGQKAGLNLNTAYSAPAKEAEEKPKLKINTAYSAPAKEAEEKPKLKINTAYSAPKKDEGAPKQFKIVKTYSRPEDGGSSGNRS
ncbi:MAG: 4Fe-4S binding protein [Lachnospiraceae bacterium]|nr:4Fe-4S binding protein [Lachnospiraceae bacterium]